MGKFEFGAWDEMEFLGNRGMSRYEARELTDIQSRFQSPGFDIVLSKLRWPAGGDLRLVSPGCWLNIFLTDPARREHTPIYCASSALISGSFVLAPPQASIQVEWGDADVDCITCWFNPADFLSIRNLSWNWAEHSVFNASSDMEQKAVSVSNLLAMEMLEPDLASEVKIESLMIYLSCQMHSWMVPRGIRSETRRRLDKSQLRLVQEMTQTGTACPTAGSLAAELGLSPRLFCELFKTSTGTTVRAYLAQQRVVRAKRLLLDPGLQIKKVAAMAGFTTTSAFAAAFHKSAGVSARTFRATHGRSI